MQRSFTALAALAAAFAIGGCAQQPAHHDGDGHAHHAHHAQHHGPGNPASQQMHRQMAHGMQQMQDMPLTGNVDRDFVRMMRMHHQQGVDMARVELEKGASPEVKAMAQKIVDAQQREIAEFDAWVRRNP
ncbi:DUF305 domain-containing protein [Ramlibacter terrae]|uniref:DUF305 domain-containing protein n=1 Tax=Ramlibacter terrae TaxID=2732511 RepID=A0ABX6P3F4_9BURK|nr:DUF305 domain-containing protein [Ramlibacter terrae]